MVPQVYTRKRKDDHEVIDNMYQPRPHRPRAGSPGADPATGLLALVLLAGALLALSGARPAAALHDLGSATNDPTTPVVALSTLLAWLCVGWLGLVRLLASAAALPGVAGQAAARLTRACAPWAVRRLLAGTLGISTLLVAPTAALADQHTCACAPGRNHRAQPRGGLARRRAAEQPAHAERRSGSAAGPQHPRPASVPARSDPSAPVAAGTAAVVVQPGDSLWTVAARALGTAATPTAVANAWPAWWAANREAIGPDPRLIHPGDRLVPPASSPARGTPRRGHPVTAR